MKNRYKDTVTALRAMAAQAERLAKAHERNRGDYERSSMNADEDAVFCREMAIVELRREEREWSIAAYLTRCADEEAKR